MSGLLGLAALVDPRAAGFALAQPSAEDAVDIVGSGGQVWRLWRQALLGLGPLLTRLRQAGVPLAPGLREVIAEDASLEEHLARQATRHARARLARALAVALVLGVAVAAELRQGLPG